MIRLDKVTKIYNAGRPNEFVALNKVSLDIELGKITVLKGPSGSGKTTLLTIMGCMARPTSGRVSLLNRDITSLPERFLAEVRRKTFGFIFQSFNLVKGLTAVENVMLPAYPLGEKRSDLEARASRLFSEVELQGKELSKIEWLSGGEAQRVAIARALINEPTVIIADEPTAHLDTARSRQFMDIVCALQDSGKTIIIASHDPFIYESEMVTTILSMRDGRLE
ncbi:MAG: ABC transporter ATP-binding protein [Dissulfurispiraceae bacterium]|jgi:putative ABC transport system ATP-binding protein|nr:ABC transporter ATP-binding protein [Dissulfurispiraceae bacterium]